MGLFDYAKKIIKHPAYTIGTSVIPNLNLSGSISNFVDPLLHLQPGGVASDWLNAAIRAGGGYLQGGKQGAVLGALGGLANNYTPVSNWINNLSDSGALGGLLENTLQGGIKATGNFADPLIGGGMGALSSLFPSLSTSPNAGQNTTATGWNSSVQNYDPLASAANVKPPVNVMDRPYAGPGAASTAGSTLGGIIDTIKNLPGGAQLALGAGALGLLGSLSGGSSSSSGGKFNPPPLWGSDSGGGSGYNYKNYGGLGYFPRQPVSPIPQQDYYTYGQRPEQLFFQNAPATGMKRGGALSYIKGSEDGRSDTVPIQGSHGEYMMDAETVSLLGNGNNEAGARKLDQMRKRLRTHKGKALAKGKFSPDAKSPEHYMGAR